MPLASLLGALGVPGTIVSVAVVLFALYHLRSGFKLLSQAATWVYAMAVALALVAIASTGVIPGIDLNPIIQFQAFASWVVDLVFSLADLLGGLLP